MKPPLDTRPGVWFNTRTMTTQPATPVDYSAHIIATTRRSLETTAATIPAAAPDRFKCAAMRALDRAATHAYRAAIAEQAHDETTRTRCMDMYRRNLEHARAIIRQTPAAETTSID